MKLELSWWDRLLLSVAPGWAMERVRARTTLDAFARHYEAASSGRRTSGWHRDGFDADVVLRTAARELRNHARDLIRNNGYARRGVNTIANGTVGWGAQPTASGANESVTKTAADLWKSWAETTECEVDGRMTFAGIQRQVVRALVSDGDVFVRRRVRRPGDGLTIPLQLQVLEADFLDTAKEAASSQSGGPIVQGIEFDAIGRRAAYWLWASHPGSGKNIQPSRRILASEILHVFDGERPGQTRGVSWLGAAIVNLRDLDEYEDAELIKQKIAACFAAFVTDMDGVGSPLGGADPAGDIGVEKFEPGMIHHLPAGRQVTVANPPGLTSDALPTRTLRKIAAALGITYEDLTGDYSQVNFSSARMARLAYQGNVHHWQWNLLLPLLCVPVWNWAMEAAMLAGKIPEAPGAEWTPAPLAMLEPDKEGLAYQRLVRSGAMTLSQMIREQGRDPVAHLTEYAADLARLDAAGIKLDSDVRAVSQAGQVQQQPAAPANDSPPKA